MAGSAPVAPGVRRLRTDVALMSSSRAAILVCGLAQSVIVSRALGPSGRGAIAVAVSLMGLFTQVGSLGLATANTYFTARDRKALGAIATNSLWFGGLAGATLAVSAVVLKLLVPSVVGDLSWPELMAVMGAMPGMLAALLLQAVLLGEGRSLAYNVLAAALQALTVVVVAVVVTVLHAGVLGVLVTIAASQMLSTCVYFAALRRHRPSRCPDLGLARRMLRYGLRVYAATVLAFIVIRIDVLLVNAYRGGHDTGLYSVAVAAVDALYLLPVIVGFNLFPRIARGAERTLSIVVFRTLAPLYGALCLVSVPLAGPAIHLLYGPRFASSVGLYYWIAPGAFSLGMVAVLSNHFAGQGFPIKVMLMWLSAVVLNIALNVLFLPDGLFIAPLASSVAYGLLLIMHTVAFAREAGGFRALAPRASDLRVLLSWTSSRGSRPGAGA
jgi:O-antigen/teichoic acid export membrane protein